MEIFNFVCDIQRHNSTTQPHFLQAPEGMNGMCACLVSLRWVMAAAVTGLGTAQQTQVCAFA